MHEVWHQTPEGASSSAAPRATVCTVFPVPGQRLRFIAPPAFRMH